MKTKKFSLIILLSLALLLNACGKTTPQFSLGTWQDDIYTNDYLDLKFTLPQDWYSTDNISLQTMLGYKEEDSVDLTTLDDTYVMMAFMLNGDNLKIISHNSAVDDKTTAEEYLNQTATFLHQMDNTYQFNTLDNIKIGKNTYSNLKATYVENGTTMEQDFLCTKIDTHYIVINYTTYTPNSFNNILANFS